MARKPNYKFARLARERARAARKAARAQAKAEKAERLRAERAAKAEDPAAHAGVGEEEEHATKREDSADSS